MVPLLSSALDRYTQTVTVYRLFRRGHLIAVGLTELELYTTAPWLRHDPEKEVVTTVEQAGTVNGQVWDWSKHGGHSRNPKIHWTCPACGQQWFTDFNAAMPKPKL